MPAAIAPKAALRMRSSTRSAVNITASMREKAHTDDDRERDRDRGEHARSGDAQRARLRNESAHGVEEGDVPRHEQLHARHHAIREQRRRRDVRQMLELPDERSRAFQLVAARGAAPDVRLERRRSESDLAVEQQVDLFWQ